MTRCVDLAARRIDERFREEKRSDTAAAGTAICRLCTFAARVSVRVYVQKQHEGSQRKKNQETGMRARRRSEIAQLF